MLYKLRLETVPILKKIEASLVSGTWSGIDTQNLLILIKDGEYKITVNEITYEMTSGDIILIPSGHMYMRTPVGCKPCSMLMIYFVFEKERFEICNGDLGYIDDIYHKQAIAEFESTEINENFDRALYIFAKTSLEQSYEKAIEICEDIFYSFKKDYLSVNLTASFDLGRLLTLLSNSSVEKILVDKSKPIPLKSERIRQAVKYIQNHIHEPISLDDLSAACNSSKYQIIRQFKRDLHTTPLSYINGQKISKAKTYLLRNHDLSIGEISAMLGFEDPLYFSRLFSKICKESPKQFRNKRVKAKQKG